MISFVKNSIKLLASIALLSSCSSKEVKEKEYILLIGTYTQQQNDGIYTYHFDTETGKSKYFSKGSGIENPSFFTINTAEDKIYAVNENENGEVSAFNFDKKNGEIVLINKTNANGAHPCYITLTKDEKHIITANYSSGNISVLEINTDGSISPIKESIKHIVIDGDNVDEKKAHAHSVINSPNGQIIYAADLGTDKIYAYSYNSNEKEPLSPYLIPYTKIKEGSGPRHFIFNQKGNIAYLISELSATIHVFKNENQQLEEIQSINMNDENFSGKNGAADIHLSKDGKFLYASNRGDVNEIVIYNVNNNSGKLTKIGKQSTLGLHPRNFIIDPTDKFLLVANKDSDNIIVFERNAETGLLKDTGEKINIKNPVFLKFIAK